MPVNTKYTAAFPDPTTFQQAKAISSEARVKSMSATVNFATTDSAFSVVYVGKLPSNARILPGSTLRYGSLTGASISVGFDVNAKPAALVSAQSIAAAGNSSLVSAVALTDLPKQVWQLAGYTQDPGGMINVIGTLQTAATAAGDVVFDLLFAV